MTIILITGAGKGIGRACALLASSLGAKVIAVARSQSDLDSLAEADARIVGWPVDVNLAEFFLKVTELETIDGLINNVGINRAAPMSEQVKLAA
ncbi:SDR family NAD(P)-dependent oxidoreductase [Thalassotalea sp. Y01]|uniref:SDR family NAD(P)-dependent oxidoreductase n=1 Tax=Thalassotalea sp. Y01 TaxID=2729613 RepID=UPI001B7D501E